MGDTEAMASLVHEYVAQTEEHITILEKVFAEEDRAAVEATAHLIKGSSRSITANVWRISPKKLKCTTPENRYRPMPETMRLSGSG